MLGNIAAVTYLAASEIENLPVEEIKALKYINGHLFLVLLRVFVASRINGFIYIPFQLSTQDNKIKNPKIFVSPGSHFTNKKQPLKPMF